MSARPFGDRGEQARQFRRPIAIIAVQEYDDIGQAGVRNPSQAGLAVSALRFRDQTRARPCRNLGRPVGRVAIYDEHFIDEAGRQIGEPHGLSPRPHFEWE
jgi:hypothetical protein